jgi:hypothetical protein
MQIIVIESEAFDALKKEIKAYVKAGVADALNEKRAAETSDWIPELEAKKLLPFRSKTSWQKIRDEGIIEFSQFGRKILYSKKSILNYLNENKAAKF